ncbi:carbohydrate ABC transporter permease [Breznakiella homolactica]|uniref:Carbohydrate ABC transporter permease n=1 Tax=Breznakiella homolactica TaxID=2798577 RepID=A0A7T8B9A5_9SPIR|nr:carbohydrate ABC transporter permease [Breznakiella homolactica]QQO08136.1 carbohydrate ABC transporter permease [Breznakiella homolactica]
MKKNSITPAGVFKYLFLIISAAIILLPLVWLATTAFKTKAEIFSNPFALLPEQFSMKNFTDAWAYAPFGKYYMNTIVTSLGLLIVQLVTVTMAAFAFARLSFPGRDLFFMLFLTQLMITPQSTIFPNYLTVSQMRLLDTRIGVMIPYFASAMGTFLLRQSFKSIPDALEDAGKLDGCNTFQLIFHIFIPEVKPAMIAFSILSVTHHWNEFMWPLLVTETARSRTLTVGLTVFAQQAEGGAEWGLLMAATLIVVLPLLIAFTLFQRLFVQSFTSSGIKG